MDKQQLAAIRAALELGDTSWDTEAYKAAFKALEELEQEQLSDEGFWVVSQVSRNDIAHYTNAEIAAALDDDMMRQIADFFGDNDQFQETWHEVLQFAIDYFEIEKSDDDDEYQEGYWSCQAIIITTAGQTIEEEVELHVPNFDNDVALASMLRDKILQEWDDETDTVKAVALGAYHWVYGTVEEEEENDDNE